MENNKHNKKAKKLFDPLRFLILLIVFIAISLTTVFLSIDTVASDNGGISYNEDGEYIYPGDTLSIRGVSSGGEICQFTNNSSEYIYFIPTRSQVEWDAVKSTASTGNHDLKLVGYGKYPACGVDCSLPWGGTILHGDSVRAYDNSNPTCCPPPYFDRTCNNGNLTGSNNYDSQGQVISDCQEGYYCNTDTCECDFITEGICTGGTIYNFSHCYMDSNLFQEAQDLCYNSTHWGCAHGWYNYEFCILESENYDECAVEYIDQNSCVCSFDSGYCQKEGGYGNNEVWCLEDQQYSNLFGSNLCLYEYTSISCEEYDNETSCELAESQSSYAQWLFDDYTKFCEWE